MCISASVWKCAIAVAMFLIAPVARAGQVLSQITDPVHSGIEPFTDVLSARIEQDGGLLTFVIETRGDIPTTLPLPEDSLTYLWFVDADNNPATGQPHGGVGSEFNVRAVISGRYGGGFVDITGSLPGGGGGTAAVQGNRIQITIGLGQIANPAQFHWRSATFHIASGQYVSGNYDTNIAVASPSPYAPPARVRLVTPYLMLCPSGPATGLLQVEIRDAAGNVRPTADYHLSFRSSDPAVVTVDNTGLATVHAAPGPDHAVSYVEVAADGVSGDNAAVVRTTYANLGLSYATYPGTFVTYYLPPTVEGVDLDQITRDYQVVEATDLAYAAEQTAIGTTTFRGNTQYFIVEVGDHPPSIPCGASGNPIRLGWEYARPIHNSCYIINVPTHRVPQWGVIFHEMGHNFTWASTSFGQFASAPSSMNVTYSEGLANLAGIWAWYSIERCPSALLPLALDDIQEYFASAEGYHRERLAAYKAAGRNYATLDPNALDGILWEMYDAYGPRAWFDFFSTFVPPNEPLPCSVNSEARQATWFVAAMSASAGEDLRGRFVADYGFPMDNEAWSSILACVQGRIAARPWQAPVVADADCDGDVDLADFSRFCACFNGPNQPPTGMQCLAADLDGDNDVDLTDFQVFSACYNGPNQQPACEGS